MLRTVITAALVALAAGQSQSTIRGEGGNLIMNSPDGGVTFKGANSFEIKTDGGEYDLNKRLSTIEESSSEHLATLRAALTEFTTVSQAERAEKFAELDEKIAANEKVLENSKKACPLGSVVTHIGEDGSLQCTDYKVQPAMSKGCAAGEVLVSTNEDGTAVCAKVQAPIQACEAGSSIASVDPATGAVTCENDGADQKFASFYTTWGRQNCAGQGELVYRGAMAADISSRTGSAATYLCLPTEKPYATAGFTKTNNGGAGINIVEYRSPYDLQMGNNRWQYNVNSGNFDYDDAACAVCKVASPNQLMVSGRNTCPAGYQLDYRGYLASHHFQAKRSMSWICLHNTPVGHVGMSEGNNRRNYMYLTEMKPNNLPKNGMANGYRKNYELNCAQCSSTSSSAVSTYTRWGRSDCPGNTKMLYDGMVGNGRYSETGNGGNYQCLARGPEYTFQEGRNAASSSRMYTVDFFTAHLSSRGTYKKVNYHDAGCAVCEVPKSEVLNMYGTQKCPDGYELEYKGLIFSGKWSDKHMTEHICVDDQPVMIQGGNTKNANTGRMHPVEISAPGAPINNGYKLNREVGCAVCKVKDERQVTTYPIWGRRACPTGSKTVHSGWMANGAYNAKGGGYNYMCMHPDGDVEAVQLNGADNRGNSGRLTRVEYTKDTKSNAGAAMARMLSKHNHDAACAVCEVEGEDTMMYPAKDACPTGYTKLYDGYVAAAHAYHPHETEYICLEKEFEGLDPKIFTLAKTTSQNAQRLVLAEVDSAFYGLKFPTNMGAQCVMCLKK